MNGLDRFAGCFRCPQCGYSCLLPLTAKDVRVCELLADGVTVTEIAKELRLSVSSVKNRFRRIYRKVDLPRPEDRFPSLQLAIYWHYPLFQEGLKAVGLLTEKSN